MTSSNNESKYPSFFGPEFIDALEKAKAWVAAAEGCIAFGVYPCIPPTELISALAKLEADRLPLESTEKERPEVLLRLTLEVVR